jgi:serine/threonine-protein kinase
MSFGPEKALAREDPSVELLHPAEEPAEPERTDPERIGRYELCFELASGGMATVYLARADGASGFEKLVALKRIHRHLAKEKHYVDMFLDEAKIASRITHPNVCSVFDFGEADGDYYLAMEYLVGEPLSRLCGWVAKDQEQRRHQLLPLRMARIIADACEGLHAAHELKDANGDLLHVVHRDVSPRNLFVTYDGSVQVVDFGIASARQRIHHTSTGELKGTFAYMAPEQLTAQPIDRRVDIWALGVTLWEMLALKRLFRRDTTANTIHAVLYDDIVPPSAYRSQVSKELDEIALKALQRDPKERWQSAREMGRALRQFLGTQSDMVGPAELSEWLAEIFPQGEARKSQLMEIARMSKAAVPVMPRGGGESTLMATEIQFAEGTSVAKPQRFERTLWVTSVFGALVMVAAAAIALTARETNLDVEAETTAPGQVDESISVEPPSVEDEQLATAPTASSTAPGRDRVEPEAEAPQPLDAKRARSPQPARAQLGTINLVTRGGWAEIYKGKEPLGSTPRRLTLPAGRHKLVLKPFGTGNPKTVFVRVQANKTKNVSVRLD